jgi:hypothetical protein
MRILFILLIAAVTLNSCGKGKSGKTSTGIKYELFQNKSGKIGSLTFKKRFVQM